MSASSDRPTAMTDTTDPAVEQWPVVPRLLAASTYCVLATADADGVPWATPVFFAARGEHELFWVSSADSRHSRNIAVRPTIAVTVFDSRATVGRAEALYLVAEAAVCDDPRDALDTMNAKLDARHALETADLVPAGPLTAYRAVVSHHDVLIRGGDPAFDNVIDQRLAVHPPATSG